MNVCVGGKGERLWTENKAEAKPGRRAHQENEPLKGNSLTMDKFTQTTSVCGGLCWLPWPSTGDHSEAEIFLGAVLSNCDSIFLNTWNKMSKMFARLGKEITAKQLCDSGWLNRRHHTVVGPSRIRRVEGQFLKCWSLHFFFLERWWDAEI